MPRSRVPRRRLAQPGLSYLDANSGRLVTVERDVLDIKSRIMSTWPELDVFWDMEAEEWVIVEYCKDHTDRLVFATSALDQRVLDRLHRADGHRKDAVDPGKRADDANDKMEAERDAKFGDLIEEHGERLLHALRKDGVDAGIPKILVPDSIGRSLRQD